MTNERETFDLIRLYGDVRPENLALSQSDWDMLYGRFTRAVKCFEIQQNLRRVNLVLVVISLVLRCSTAVACGFLIGAWDLGIMGLAVFCWVVYELLINGLIGFLLRRHICGEFAEDMVNDSRIESTALLMNDINAWNARVALLNLMPNLVALGQMTPEQMATIQAGARREHSQLIHVRLPLAVNLWLLGGPWGECTIPAEQMTIKALEIYLPPEERSKMAGTIFDLGDPTAIKKHEP